MGVRKRRARKSARTRRWIARFAIAVIAFFALGVALTLPLRWLDPSTTAFMLGDDSGRDPLLFEWQDWEQLGSAIALERGDVEPDTYVVDIGTGEVTDRDTRTQETFWYLSVWRLPPSMKEISISGVKWSSMIVL